MNNNNNNNNQNNMAAAGANRGYFLGAPASKLFVVVTVFSYILIHNKKAHAVIEFDSNKINESYRLLTSKLTFSSTGDLVMGGVLLAYLSRKVEREMGSRKFVTFFLAMLFLSMIFEGIVVKTILYMWRFRYSGPYGLIGALFWLHHVYTPRLHPRFFGVLGFNFSEKSFGYIWFCQVVLSGGRHSLFAAMCGALACALFTTVPLFSNIDLPDPIVNLVSPLGERLLETPPRILVPQVPNARNRGNNNNARPAAAGGPRHNPHRAVPVATDVRPVGPPQGGSMAAMAAAVAAAAQQPATPPAAVAPDPSALEQLLLMGFERQDVIEALQSTNNNVERAADRLLTQAGVM